MKTLRETGDHFIDMVICAHFTESCDIRRLKFLRCCYGLNCVPPKFIGESITPLHPRM